MIAAMVACPNAIPEHVPSFLPGSYAPSLSNQLYLPMPGGVGRRGVRVVVISCRCLCLVANHMGNASNDGEEIEQFLATPYLALSFVPRLEVWVDA